MDNDLGNEHQVKSIDYASLREPLMNDDDRKTLAEYYLRFKNATDNIRSLDLSHINSEEIVAKMENLYQSNWLEDHKKLPSSHVDNDLDKPLLPRLRPIVDDPDWIRDAQDPTSDRFKKIHNLYIDGMVDIAGTANNTDLPKNRAFENHMAAETAVDLLLKNRDKLSHLNLDDEKAVIAFLDTLSVSVHDAWMSRNTISDNHVDYEKLKPYVQLQDMVHLIIAAEEIVKGSNAQDKKSIAA